MVWDDVDVKELAGTRVQDTFGEDVVDTGDTSTHGPWCPPRISES